MKIDFQQIAVRELVNGYTNNQEDGVFAYDGKLNIRPPYQREFVYKIEPYEALHDCHPRQKPLQ